MPVAYLDLPSGLAADTKKKLVKEVVDSIYDAYTQWTNPAVRRHITF
jgi:hypothetical protein